MVYSFNPQVHAFDDLSVMETLEHKRRQSKLYEGSAMAQFTSVPSRCDPVSFRSQPNQKTMLEERTPCQLRWTLVSGS